jgi:hypothetical protein
MDISALHAGFPGISPEWGASLAQAASVSLEAQGHIAPRECIVYGSVSALHDLTWPATTDQIRRTWNDIDEAVEHGAYGMAALLVAEHTDLEVVERSRKGTGFDYWLGPKGVESGLFQQAARLEVSGIGRGDESAVNSRVKKKLEQTAVSDGLLPAYVVVVEFGTPCARVIRK